MINAWAVAQLGERFVRNEEVVSSILISSTWVKSTIVGNNTAKNKYLIVGVLFVHLGSSPAQQSIAQPRQVRKEATVGKQFCVTQGSLTSFLIFNTYGRSRWLNRSTVVPTNAGDWKRYNQYGLLLYNHSIFYRQCGASKRSTALLMAEHFVSTDLDEDSSEYFPVSKGIYIQTGLFLFVLKLSRLITQFYC